ncbi:MAG: DUF6789 family protein [Geminicoccales bacterium]
MTRSGIQDIRKGMLASFAGTIVLSIIMVTKQMAGIAPQMNPIADLADIAHRLIGLPAAALIGWVLHFGVGIVVWGTLFAALHQRIPGSNLIKGILFGIGAWVLMMVVFQPIAGQGLFGLNGGMVVPMMTLMLHFVYGVVLGLVFAKLSAR